MSGDYAALPGVLSAEGFSTRRSSRSVAGSGPPSRVASFSVNHGPDQSPLLARTESQVVMA
jgi:hypothetical protein